MYAFSSVSDTWSPRQQRHIYFISEFSSNVRRVHGAAEVVADAGRGICRHSLAVTPYNYQNDYEKKEVKS